MKRALLAVAMLMSLLLFPSVTQADTSDLYLHNGSVVEFDWDVGGDGFEVRYVVPRNGLNIAPGTLLLEGSVPANGSMYATARTFKRGCAPAQYDVEGSENGSTGVIRLFGLAPVRASNGCRVIGYERTGNSLLVFTPLN